MDINQPIEHDDKRSIMEGSKLPRDSHASIETPTQGLTGADEMVIITNLAMFQNPH